MGYPVHRVASYSEHDTANHVLVTTWTAGCGATGKAVGRRPFGKAGSARAKELCPHCFDKGVHGYYPDPATVPAG
ncbi:hypothetical protein L3Q67_45050 (plasmid) [Saccharothrix sp. AJ9571]|nr:hypothetical protein L3Q67_45050 [Saccharothrix sp. AJ9571]